MVVLKTVLYVVFVVVLVAYAIKRNKTNIRKMERNNREK